MQIETIKSGKLFRATEIDALNGDVIEGIYGSIEKEKLQQGCLLEMDLSRAKSVTARGVAGFLRIYKFLESRGASLEIMAIGKTSPRYSDYFG